MSGIIQGVNPASGYTDPKTAGAAIALGVTPDREQLDADLESRQRWASIAVLCSDILTECQLQNRLLFPGEMLEPTPVAVALPAVNFPVFQAGRPLFYAQGAGSFASASSQFLSVVTPMFSTVGPASVSCWVKITDLSAARGLWGQSYLGGGTQVVACQASAGGGNIQVSFDGFSHTKTTAGTLTTGIWHHVVITYDGTTCNIWVDGVKDANSGSLASSSIATTHTIIGATSTTQSPMNGQEDAAAFWAKVLSDAEITILYNGGSGLACKNSTGPLLTSLVSGYDFDGPGANLVRDSIGSNTLTQSGSPVTFTQGWVKSFTLVPGDTYYN